MRGVGSTLALWTHRPMSRPCALTGWYNGKRAASNDRGVAGGNYKPSSDGFCFGTFSALDRKRLIENDGNHS